MEKGFFIGVIVTGFILVVGYFIFLSEDSIIDMNNIPCHRMSDGTIMGKCSKEDIKRLEEETEKKEFPTFLPMSELSFSELSWEKPTAIIELENKDKIRLRVEPIIKDINGNQVKMYGYNGEVPGPLLKVRKGSTINVEFFNNIDLDTTIHWHGVRVSNANDGVPNITQKVVKPGSKFLYTLKFPDEGIYWYHPHFREDIQQDLGLYGNILVYDKNIPKNFNREEFLILDDILIKDNEIISYGKEEANYALTGRFGNVMLVNGRTDYSLNVNKEEVIRFYITNTANTRPFNISFSGAKIKLVGSDIGYYEREEFIDSVIIGPAERYIVDVFFEKESEYKIINVNPTKKYELGKIVVRGTNRGKNYFNEFNLVKENEVVKKEIDKYREYFDKDLDYQIELDVDMEMHGMRMMQMQNNEDGIEWEDEIGMNAVMTSSDLRWILRDKESGKENMDVMYKFKVGDKVKIRIINKENSMHPMQHPIHFHGQRFLVLNLDGKKNQNLVWKDSVLVPAGSYVDILLDVSNPGKWIAHCHIPEHMESGMMLMFDVAR